MKKYSYRFYKPGDEIEIIRLFEIVYQKRMSLKWWQWRYAKNPFNNQKIVLAFDENKLIAHYAVSPTFIGDAGRTFKCALSMTTMTHPNYEGLGLFVDLAEMLYSDLKADNFDLVYGFPNHNSHGVFVNKLGWKDIGVICNLNFDLRSNEFNNLALSNNEITLVDDLSQLATFSKGTAFSTPNDANYLNWRFSLASGNDYRALSNGSRSTNGGYLIYKDYKRNSIDLVHAHGDINCQIELIKHLISNYLAAGYTRISTWSNIHGKMHTQLERLGFRLGGEVSYFGGIELSNNPELLNLESWAINMSLSDVF